MGERTIVFYHGGCPDGFGGAYAAWKKLGTSAEYISLSRNEEPPVETARGNKVYFIDFVYTKDVMDRFLEAATSLTVLDHHEGVQDVIESMPDHVYSTDHSGATLAWNYFHPGEAIPELLQYIEDDDLFRFSLPDTRPMLAYLGVNPTTFEFWDEVASMLADPSTRETLIMKARTYGEYFELLADLAVEKSVLVEFEGYTCAFATAHPYKPMKSLVGNKLAKKYPPIALVVAAHPYGYGVSIRGDGSVNVAAIAEKFGGNGHTSSAGFLIPREGPYPWTLIKDDANPRD